MSKAVIQARPGTPHGLLSPAFLLTAVAVFMLAIDNLFVVRGAFAAVGGYGNAATLTLRLVNESGSA
jgi:hypothetical protein